MKIKNQKGFTLIEAMIAVVVFSFGLLGIAGIMTVAVKNNHNGYMRSQAAFLAASIIDTMRRNQIGLWEEEYNGTYSGYTDVSSDCDYSGGCTHTNIAARDVAQWASMIDQVLPNSEGTITCVEGDPPSFAIPVMIDDPLNPGAEVECHNCAIEPYSGMCTIEIEWSESNSVSSDAVQTLELIGKP